MHTRLAIIETATDIVVNTIVPPEGSDVYFLPSGHYGVLTDVGNIGDTYVQEFDEFLPPESPEEPEQPEPPAE